MNDTIFANKRYHHRTSAKTALWLKLYPFIIPTAIFLVALLPRIAGLETFLTADEDDQIMFASLFLKSALEGDLSNALILGYPGIPTLVLGACGVGFRYLFHYQGWLPLPWVEGDLMTTLGETTVAFGQFTHPLDFIWWVRSPMAIMAALCVVGIYLLSRRLLGEPLALLATMIIAFDPFILAHTRVIHVDAPLAYFMFISFLGFLLYIVEGKWRFLFTSGLFAGLAALSKTGPAIFLGPILLISGLIYVLFYPRPAGKSRWRYALRLMMALLGCGLIGGIAFAALFPNMWSNPYFVIDYIIGNLESVNRMYHPTTGIFWGDGMTDQSALYYLYVLPYHLTPLTSIGVLLSLGLLIMGALSYRHQTQHWLADKFPLAMSLIAYTVLFIAPVSLVTRRGDRYIVPVYFAIGLLAALGLWWAIRPITRIIQRRFLFAQYHVTPGRLMGSVIFVQIISVLMLHPYYLAYFNPLMGGGATAPYHINIGWGEGLDQAARYLNTVTKGSKSVQVAAWYSNQFAPYYNGLTTDMSNESTTIYSDYTVFYINQVQRGFPSGEILDYFKRREPLQVIKIGGVDYAWIYDGPVVGNKPPEAYTFPAQVVLGGGAHLLGIEIPHTTFPTDAYAGPQTASDMPPVFGEKIPGLPITLHWETLSKIHGEHNVYIRLMDEQGNSWGQVDRLILAGLWRPDRWKPGFFIQDEYRLPIDPATPPGTYHFEVGLYDFVTGQTYGVAQKIGAVTLTPPQTLVTAADLQVQQQTQQPINDSLSIVAHTYENKSIPPGAELQGKIFWQLDQPLSKNYNVQFWLRPPDMAHGQRPLTDHAVPARNSATFAERYIVHEAPLSSMYPPTQWRQAEVVGAAYPLRASAYAPAGEYPLMVSVIDPESDQTVGEAVELAQITVEEVQRNYTLPADVTAVSAYLNHEIELVGYKLGNKTTHAEGTIDLTLYWRSVRPAQTNYTVFVHAVGPDQLMRGQWDSMPVQGMAPTSGWLPGEIIEDHYQVLMQKDAPPWKYDIRVGMYDADTGLRIPVSSNQLDTTDNRLFLDQVLVVE